jgi:hypothetical protein
MLPCKSSCRALDAPCSAVYEVAKSSGLGDSLINCDTDTVGHPRSALTGFGVDYLESEKGQTLFQEASYTSASGKKLTCADATGLDVIAAGCKPAKCEPPMVRVGYPVRKLPPSIDPGNMSNAEYCANLTNLDCSLCVQVCEWPCPYPSVMYSDGEQEAQWLIQFVPGFLALPLNVLVIVSEIAKLRAMKKKDLTDRVVLFSACLSLLLFFTDSAPSLALRADNHCNGYKTEGLLTNMLGHPSCGWRELRVHIQQALMFTVVCNLYKVRRQLKASRRMSKYTPSSCEKAAVLMLIFGLPGLLALFAMAYRFGNIPKTRAGVNDYPGDERFGQPLVQTSDYFTMVLWHASPPHRTTMDGDPYLTMLYHPNNIRNMYTCGPFYNTVELEFVVVSFPLLVAALMSAGLAFSLLAIVLDMKKAPSSSGNKTVVTLARAMLRFAAVTVPLCMLNIASTALYLPQAATFAGALGRFSNCITTGISQNKLFDGGSKVTKGTTVSDVYCGDKFNQTIEGSIECCENVFDLTPPSLTLVLMAASSSLPPLAFGLIFAWGALKQLQSLLSKRLSSVFPTSSFRGAPSGMSATSVAPRRGSSADASKVG